MSGKIGVVYVTNSDFKREENRVFAEGCRLPDGRPVRDVFTFRIERLPVKEILDVDLAVMVEAEVVSAYSQIKVPCIVEHAGLIFADCDDAGYPGGLTKPMWNALGPRFIAETGSANRRAKARAVIAYCDGMRVETFVGEREGTIAAEPAGRREFYWDTVFIPDDPAGRAAGRTYADIVDDPSLGLGYKVCSLSQSTAAMLKFLEYRLAAGNSDLWG